MENKGALLTYHYRAVSSTTPGRCETLVQRAVQLFHEHGFYPHHTQMAIEARPPVPWDKGRASLYIMRTTYGVDWPQRVGGPERVRILYAGDDDTDEEVMEALGGLACTFRVSKMPVYRSAANYRLTDPDAVQSLLHWLEERLHQRSVVLGHPVGFTSSFLVTCIHHSETVTSDEDQCDPNSESSPVKRRRRRSSRNSASVLTKVAAAGLLLRSTNFKAALCHHTREPIDVIGH